MDASSFSSDLFPTNRLAAYRLRCKPLTQRSISAASPASIGLDELLAKANEQELQQWQTLDLGYLDTQGDEQLRAQIASQYPGLTPEHIVTFAGAQEAIFAVSHALMQPEDQCVAITPIYEPLILCAQGMGAWIHFCAMDYNADFGWDLDLNKWKNHKLLPGAYIQMQ